MESRSKSFYLLVAGLCLCASGATAQSNSIDPLFSAIMALSFGLLASNNSATLGKPPVMSLVLEVPLGNLAKTSPAETLWPSFIDRIESGTK